MAPDFRLCEELFDVPRFCKPDAFVTAHARVVSGRVRRLT